MGRLLPNQRSTMSTTTLSRMQIGWWYFGRIWLSMVLPSLQQIRMAIVSWLYGEMDDDNNTDDGKVQEDDHVGRFDSIPMMPQSLLHMPTNDTNRHDCQFGPPALPIAIATDNSFQNNMQKHTIFVSIPSYRDSKTHPTIHSLFQSAYNPHCTYIGIVYQYGTKSRQPYTMHHLPIESCHRHCQWAPIIIILSTYDCSGPHPHSTQDSNYVDIVYHVCYCAYNPRFMSPRDPRHLTQSGP